MDDTVSRDLDVSSYHEPSIKSHEVEGSAWTAIEAEVHSGTILYTRFADVLFIFCSQDGFGTQCRILIIPSRLWYLSLSLAPRVEFVKHTKVVRPCLLSLFSPWLPSMPASPAWTSKAWLSAAPPALHQ